MMADSSLTCINCRQGLGGGELSRDEMRRRYSGGTDSSMPRQARKLADIAKCVARCGRPFLITVQRQTGKISRRRLIRSFDSDEISGQVWAAEVIPIYFGAAFLAGFTVQKRDSSRCVVGM